MDHKTFEDAAYKSHSQVNRNMKECLDDKQALSTFIETPSVQTCQDDLPITSTAVRETRVARRSTRLATRMSLHKAMFSKLSPEMGTHPQAATSINETGHSSFVGDVTVVQANATVIQTYNDLSVLNSFSSDTSLKYKTDEVPLKQNITKVNRNEQNSKPEKNYRRRSSRVEALKATQKNQMIFQDQSPFSSTTKKRRSYSTKNVSCKFQIKFTAH